MKTLIDLARAAGVSKQRAFQLYQAGRVLDGRGRPAVAKMIGRTLTFSDGAHLGPTEARFIPKRYRARRRAAVKS